MLYLMSLVVVVINVHQHMSVVYCQPVLFIIMPVHCAGQAPQMLTCTAQQWAPACEVPDHAQIMIQGCHQCIKDFREPIQCGTCRRR